MNEVTRILSAIEQGDPHAAEELLDAGQLTKPAAFDPLRSRADFQELVRTLEEKAKMK